MVLSRQLESDPTARVRSRVCLWRPNLNGRTLGWFRWAAPLEMGWFCPCSGGVTQSTTAASGARKVPGMEITTSPGNLPQSLATLTAEGFFLSHKLSGCARPLLSSR